MLMSVGPTEFRAFTGQFSTGIAVVTACDSVRRGNGLTLNAVAAVSQDPPLYLVCLGARSNTLTAVRESRCFCVHFLGRGQEHVARVFASKRDDKFEGVAHRIGDSGSPLIEGVLAAAECRARDLCEAGDTTVVIGSVERVHLHAGAPLIYHRGRYTGLTEETTTG